MEKEKYVMIPLEKLTASKINPRRSFNEEDLKELAKSISEIGIINPITVREVKDHYEIISGERRFRAAKMAELTEVPAIIRDVTEADVLEIQIIENLQRVDIHPLDEVFGFDQLLRSGFYSKESIANKIGKSESYITKRMQLLKLNKDIQDSFLENRLTLGHAFELARLNDKQQKKAYEYAFNNYNGICRVSDLKEWIVRTFHLDLSKAVFNPTDKNLLEGATACTDCPRRTGFNKSLFDDIQSEDICTNPDCYHKKVQAHIDKQIQSAEKKGKPIVKISNSYYMSDADKKKNPDVLSRNDYHKINNSDKEDKCEYAQEGIVVSKDNWDNVRIGEKIKICNDPDCPVHGKNHNSASNNNSHEESEEDKKAQLERQIYIQAFEETNTELLTDVLDHVTFPLKEVEILDLIINELIDSEIVYSVGETFLFRHGIEETDNENESIRELFSKMKPSEKIKNVVELLLLNDLDYRHYKSEDDNKIRSLASKLFGANIKASQKAAEKRIKKKLAEVAKAEAADKKAQEEASSEDKPAKGKKSLKIPRNTAA